MKQTNSTIITTISHKDNIEIKIMVTKTIVVELSQKGLNPKTEFKQNKNTKVTPKTKQ